MTEWNASEYARRSGLQEAMAEEVLAQLELKGWERVLDVGCGDGRITAAIAGRVPQGKVLGVDSSHQMVSYAAERFGPPAFPNIEFEAADASELSFRDEFDLVVSFNALHWVPEQDPVLRGIRQAMKAGAIAQLRLVPTGQRKSLENVLEETRLSERWHDRFAGFHDPYLHATPEQYAAMAERNGLKVLQIHTAEKAWDFGSREAFRGFGAVTFVEWTRRLGEEEKPQFIEDVLNRYRMVAADKPGEENVFKFYQMDIRLARAGG